MIIYNSLYLQHKPSSSSASVDILADDEIIHDFNSFVKENDLSKMNEFEQYLNNPLYPFSCCLEPFDGLI